MTLPRGQPRKLPPQALAPARRHTTCWPLAPPVTNTSGTRRC